MVFGWQGLGTGREYLSIEAVVKQTGLSQSRIRQREEAGTFPARISFGPRAGLWLRDQVRAWKRAQENPTTTPQVSTTPRRQQPLERIVDEVARIPAWRLREDGEYHVRVFARERGSLEDAVVVLSKLPGSPGPSVTNAAEEIMTWVDSEYLAGAGASALWFDTYTMEGSYRAFVRNIVATKQDGKFVDPIWPPTQISDVDKVLGFPLEWYPTQAHTRDTIRRWKSTGERTVDVVHDRFKQGDLLQALQYLHDLPESHPRRKAASELAPLVAYRFHTIESLQLPETLSPRDDAEEFPTRFAARLVPYTPTPQMRRILEQYPERVEDGEAVARLLHDELRDWIESVDRYSDAPDPTVFHHLEQVLPAVTWLARDLAESYFPERNPTQVFIMTGKWDERFIDAIEEHPEYADRREGRMLREQLIPDALRYGRAPGGHIVAWGELDVETKTISMGIIWPTEPKPFPSHATLVASGDSGDRPVYIAIGDTIVDLLSRSSQFNGWNFGYGGGGPGQLEHDIIRQLAAHTGLPYERMPRAWIEDQVEHSSKDVLEIRIEDAIRRITPA